MNVFLMAIMILQAFKKECIQFFCKKKLNWLLKRIWLYHFEMHSWHIIIKGVILKMRFNLKINLDQVRWKMRKLQYVKQFKIYKKDDFFSLGKKSHVNLLEKLSRNIWPWILWELIKKINAWLFWREKMLRAFDWYLCFHIQHNLLAFQLVTSSTRCHLATSAYHGYNLVKKNRVENERNVKVFVLITY